MSGFRRQVTVVARRDFKAVVATPTFLLFLLAPLFMILMSLLGVTGAAQMAGKSQDRTRIAAIATAADGQALLAADARLRDLLPGELQPPKLVIVPSHGTESATVARHMLTQSDPDFVAILYGPLEKPVILKEDGRRTAYISALAEQAMRDRRANLAPGQRLSTPQTAETRAPGNSTSSQHLTGYGAVFGVALLFVGFWASFAGAAIALSGDLLNLPPIAAAVGTPAFIVLCALYFTSAFMLLGAIFLGVGAQASTMREIQMMSLPITIFQVAMFGLSSAAASDPHSKLARFAEIFPFSSPFAMAAHAATAPDLWPHALALGWQTLWVALTVWVAARLFRRGVLKSGQGLLSAFRKRA